MTETVRLGDSFSSLAERLLGDESRWPEIEDANRLHDPGVLLFDQRVNPPAAGQFTATLTVTAQAGQAGRQSHLAGAGVAGGHDRRGVRRALVPGHSYVFVIADEVNPLRGKVIRRVITSPRLAAAATRAVGRPVGVFPNPERFGFSPSDPNAKLSLGRHAQGMKPSPYQSASRTQPLGTRRFVGKPFWIDEAKARAAGATFHEAEEVVRDLERIIAKTKDAVGRARLAEIVKLVRTDREVLIRGAVPASAIKGPLAMGATRALQGIQIVGFVMSAIDLTQGAERTIHEPSVRPLAASTVRVAGGWASAWAGMQLGALGGAAIGIETGPGAVLTAAVGSIAGGIAGYFGFGWIADHIDTHP